MRHRRASNEKTKPRKLNKTPNYYAISLYIYYCNASSPKPEAGSYPVARIAPCSSTVPTVCYVTCVCVLSYSPGGHHGQRARGARTIPTTTIPRPRRATFRTSQTPDTSTSRLTRPCTRQQTRSPWKGGDPPPAHGTPRTRTAPLAQEHGDAIRAANGLGQHWNKSHSLFKHEAASRLSPWPLSAPTADGDACAN